MHACACNRALGRYNADDSSVALCLYGLQVHAEALTTTAVATEAVVVAASGAVVGLAATSLSPPLLPLGGVAQVAPTGSLQQVRRFLLPLAGLHCSLGFMGGIVFEHKWWYSTAMHQLVRTAGYDGVHMVVLSLCAGRTTHGTHTPSHSKCSHSQVSHIEVTA